MITQLSIIAATLLLQARAYEVPNMFYIFQQQWPGTICELNRCGKENLGSYKGKTWAIHGLWPSATDANGECEDLHFCEQKKYNPSALSKATLSKLDEAWVGFFNPSGNFRSHEWQKHGTCWDEKDDLVPQHPGLTVQEEYFQTALELWKIYDIHQILLDKGIKPDANAKYNTNDIKQALQGKLKAEAQLLCTKDDGGALLLMSVSFCTNEQYTPIRCPCPVYGGIPCGKNKNDKVYYIPFRV